MTPGLWHAAYRVAFLLRKYLWRLFRANTRGVAIGVWHEGRILLIRNSYQPQWTIPAGGIHRGEEAHAAARRELREEVGLAVETLHPVGEYVSRDGGHTNTVYLFELHCSTAPEIKVDGREVVHAAFEDPAVLTERPHWSVLDTYLAAVQAAK